MTAAYPSQASFSKGELSPLLGSRADIEFWRTALYQCRNFHVLTHGGIRRRSGTRYVATVANSAVVARLFPFIFSETQAYVLALNSGQMRFIANRGWVESGGSPYQIAHPWTNAEISRLSYAQFNDVAYFAHRSRQTRKLTRTAETNWGIENFITKDGPFLERELVSTTLRPSARGAIHPVMTSNSAPSGTVASNTSSVDAYRVFDGNAGNRYTDSTASQGWLSYTPPSSRVCDAYWIKAANNREQISAPATWTFEGYDGSNWVVLDSRQAELGWQRGEVRYFEFNNEDAYAAYRINWTATDTTANTDGAIAEMGLHERAENQTPFNLTASSTAGINGGSGFLTSDVGRSIRLRGTDGRWRWAVIVARTSTTVVTIRLYSHSLPDTSAITEWRMGALSASSGWPACVNLYDERLMLGRTDTKPVTVWGSKQGTFDDYGLSDPLLATDALSITLLSSNMNELLWIADDEDLVTGSAGQIRSIGPSDITQSFSATNITQRKGPTSGAAPIQPISIGGTVLYVGSGGKKVRELILGEQNRYVAPELSLIGEHFFKSGVKEWSFQERPDPTIWCVMNDGLLTAVTYDREQRVVGFASHDVGGIVENVATIPGQNGNDDVYLVVRRTINGSTVRYIEVLEEPFDHIDGDIRDGFFVDCGVSYDGTPITTVTGLGHLEGEEVLVLADGGEVRGLTVSTGQITLPYAASKIHVGLAYRSRAISLPVSGPGIDGTLFGRRRTVTNAFVDLLRTGSLKVGAWMGEGSPYQVFEAVMKDGGGMFGSPPDLATGFMSCEVEGSWAEGNGQVVMETDTPMPAIIRSLALQLESEP